MTYNENMTYDEFLDFMNEDTENVFVHTENSQRLVASNGLLFLVDSEDYETNTTDGYEPLSPNVRGFEYSSTSHYEVT